MRSESILRELRIFWPTLIGALVSVAYLLIKAHSEVRNAPDSSSVTLMSAAINELGTNFYLVLIPPIFAQLAGTLIKLQDVKESVSTSSTEAVKKLTEIRDQLIGETGLVRNLSELSSDDIEMIGQASASIGRMNRISKRDQSLSALLQWRKQFRARLFAEALNSDLAGFIDIPAEDELAINTEIIVVTNPTSIKAISIDDEEYWRSPIGKSFFEEQARYLKKTSLKRHIERIFVLRREGEYKEVINLQVKSGISVRLISYEMFAGVTARNRLKLKEGEEDFVIYDGSFVKKSSRYAKSTRSESEGIVLKDAQIVFDKALVQHYIGLYDAIAAAASRVRS